MESNKRCEQRLDERHEWLLLGAKEKARTVLDLTKRLEINSVIEIGCGTGAVLETLDKHGFAKEYYAIEPSESHFKFMKNRNNITRLVFADQNTLRMSSLNNRSYDLAILSHVLEHLVDPAALLMDTLMLAKHVIVEVPLEGNAMGNLRASIKKKISGTKRHNNAAGHIQFFSRSDIYSLVDWCGGEVIRSRLYVPRDQMRKSITAGSFPKRIYATWIYLCSIFWGDAIWGRAYHGHYGVLTRRKPQTPSEERSKWPKDNYYEEDNSAAMVDERLYDQKVKEQTAEFTEKG